MLLLSHPQDGRFVDLAVARALLSKGKNLSGTDVGRHHNVADGGAGRIRRVPWPFPGLPGTLSRSYSGYFHYLARPGRTHDLSLLSRSTVARPPVSRHGAVADAGAVLCGFTNQTNGAKLSKPIPCVSSLEEPQRPS